MLLRCDPPLLPTPRQLAAKKDYEVLHAGHTDWVTRLQHIPGWLAPWRMERTCLQCTRMYACMHTCLMHDACTCFCCRPPICNAAAHHLTPRHRCYPCHRSSHPLPPPIRPLCVLLRPLVGLPAQAWA